MPVVHWEQRSTWLTVTHLGHLAVNSVCWPDCKPEEPLFSAEFVCLCVCVCVSDHHFCPSALTDFDETLSQGPLNAAKTEFMWFVPPRHRHQLPSDHLAVSTVQVKPADSVRDLGVYLDSDLSMKSHITRLVCTCFGVLRQIRSIRRSLPRESVLTLISSLVMSKLDYCNVAFAGLPRGELDRLQSVINAAACLTVGAQLHDHITPLLADLHWLQIPQCIQYKLCVLVFNCVHGPRRYIYKRSSVRSITFMFDIMLDAVGNVLKVDYKSWKCDVSFSQGTVSTLCR